MSSTASLSRHATSLPSQTFFGGPAQQSTGALSPAMSGYRNSFAGFLFHHFALTSCRMLGLSFVG